MSVADASARFGDRRPQVVILNLGYSGLGVARQLAGRGIRMTALSAERGLYGNFTRLCEVRVAPSSRDEPEQLARFLQQAADDLGGAVIFPTSDFDVRFLDRFRDRLEPRYRLSIPPRDCLLRVMDKRCLIEAARGAGVAVPRTVWLDSPAAARAEREVGFPAVVKPVSSFHWRARGSFEVVRHRKAFRVESAAELDAIYRRVAPLHPEIVVQEWIPGGAERLVVWGGYAAEESKPLAYFTARKLVQWPEDFGTGCLVESCEIPEILPHTMRLLEALKYRGMAEIEYKQDPRTGEYKLIEINARHWDWHELGSASGVDLSWTAYRHLTGAPVAPMLVRVARAKWMADDALFWYCLRGGARREIGLGKLWKQLFGRRIYGIFRPDDPLPFVMYWLTVPPAVLGEKTARFFRGRAGISWRRLGAKGHAKS